jgi:putative YhdH/YhfP family quinone oxidoreductase
MASFHCYLVEKGADGRVTGGPATRPVSDLPAGEVLIRVAYSSLNYKDGLSATGHPGVTRKFPHVPGIDASGVVEESTSPAFKTGDGVLVTGHDLGQNTWGGFSQLVRVPAAWVVPLPVGLTARDAMIYGTAGLTAALSVAAIQKGGVRPDQGEVVVTGSTGGVGSLAVALLSKAGFRVAAVTGKADAEPFLRSLGAERVIGREEVIDASNRPLLSVRWSAAVDTVGGAMLGTVIRSTERAGVVAVCGLVGGTEVPLTVYPLILRGITIAGIDSAECPLARRTELWERLAGPWRPNLLESIVSETVSLGGITSAVGRILKGGLRGRVLVRPE